MSLLQQIARGFGAVIIAVYLVIGLLFGSLPALIDAALLGWGWL